jgi:hypothetical protein
VSDKPREDDAMTTEDLHERLQGIQGCWDQALADLQEVSGGLEAIIKTPGENDLVAIAKHYGRDPKVFAIGMFDAVIMLKALTTVLEMTEPMLKKILPLTVEEHLEAQDEVLHRLLGGLDRRPRAHVPFLRRRAEAAGSRQSEERGCSFV